MPKAVWVRSLVPKEKNSAVSAISAARNDAQVAHVGAAFGLAVAEAEDPFRFGGSVGRRLFGRMLRRRGRLAGRGLAGGAVGGRFDTARRRFDHEIPRFRFGRAQ